MNSLKPYDKILYRALATRQVIQFQNFCTYKSGGKGEYFFDIDEITADYTLSKALVDKLYDQIKEIGIDFNCLGILKKEKGPIGLMPIASNLGQMLEKNLTYFRLFDDYIKPEMKVKGTKVNKDDLPLMPDTSILLLEDETTTGTTLEEAINLIESLKGKVAGIVCCFVMYEDKVNDLMEKKEIPFFYLYSKKEMEDMGYISIDLNTLIEDDLLKRTGTRLNFSSETIEDFRKNLVEELSSKLGESYTKLDNDKKRRVNNFYLNGILRLRIKGT